MRVTLSAKFVKLLDALGNETHRIEAHEHDGVFHATLLAKNSITGPKYVFTCDQMSSFYILGRAYLADKVARDVASIQAYRHPQTHVLPRGTLSVAS